MRHHSRLYAGHRRKHRRHQRPEQVDIVALRMNEDDSDGNTSEILLVLQIAIDREQEVKFLCRKPQEFTILDASPSGLSDRLDFVARKLLSERAWNALVKQHAHRRSNGLWPARALQSRVPE